MATADKRPGRKPLPDDKRLVVVPLRFTPAQRAKLKQPGVVPALRAWLDAMPMPAKEGSTYEPK